MDYVVPEKPLWLDNGLGKTAQVLPPWTPLQADSSAVRLWGRRYDFGQSPLPRAITSQDRSLLRAPISLTIQSGGAESPLTMKPVAPIAGDGTAMHGSWSGSLGPLSCTATNCTEFDGFLLVDFQLKPGSTVDVDNLRLTIPLRAECATLYHHADGNWTDRSEAGAIGATGWSKRLPFVPYVWMGDEKGGVAWCCDANPGWHNADTDRAIELRHTDEGVDLLVHHCGHQDAFGRTSSPDLWPHGHSRQGDARGLAQLAYGEHERDERGRVRENSPRRARLPQYRQSLAHERRRL